jgi:GDSL-like Lipase/Acylhydrolase family
MRIALALILAVAIAAAAFFVSRDERTAAGSVTLVGDSLNVGTEPYLREELAGWTIDAHDRVGRSTAEGIAELRSLGGTAAPIVVVSLGTNDAHGSENEFRQLVAQAVELVGPERCLVWATIVRDGTARDGFNEVLADAAAEHVNVRLVDWAAIVADDPSALGPDAVHGTPDGYALRASGTSRAIRACPEPRA